MTIQYGAIDFKDGATVNGGQVLQTGTSAALTYYVATTGSDSNDGLSVGSPFLTIQKAIDSAPKFIRHPVVINVGLGNFGGFEIRGFNVNYVDVNQNAYLMIIGTLQNTTVTTGSASGTATSAAQGSNGNPFTSAVLNDAGQTWTVNDLRGKFITITGGTGSGQFLPIESNTATQVSIASTAWTVLPDATSTYAIQEPGSIINAQINRAGLPTGIPPTTTPGSPSCVYITNNQLTGDVSPITLQRIKFSPPLTVQQTIRVGEGSALTINNCSFVNNVTHISGATSGTASGRLIVTGCTFNSTAGHIQVIGNQSNPTGAGLSASGNVHVNGFGIGMGGCGSVLLTVSYFYGCTAGVRSVGYAHLWQTGTLRFSGCTTALSSVTSFPGLGVFTMQAATNIDIINCTTGFDLESRMTVITSIAAFTGSGNTTAINIRKGASIQFTSSSTLTGTTEISQDGVTTTAATMRAASPKVLTNNYGTIIFE